MERRRASVAVAVVVLAAGGVALVVTDDGGSTGPGSTGPGSTGPGSTGLESIDGASETGVSVALADTHDSRILSLDSFRYNASTARPAGDGLVEVSYELRADTEAETYLAERTVGETTVTTYYEDGTAYQRRENASGTFYSVLEESPSPLARVRALDRTVRRLAAEENVTLAERIDVDGGEGYRYVTEDVNPAVIRTVPAESVNAELVVGPEGAVRVLELSYAPRIEIERDRVTVRGRFTGFNATTVSRPDWVDEAATRGGTTDAPAARNERAGDPTARSSGLAAPTANRLWRSDV
jgi:hypothetical protein